MKWYDNKNREELYDKIKNQLISTFKKYAKSISYLIYIADWNQKKKEGLFQPKLTDYKYKITYTSTTRTCYNFLISDDNKYYLDLYLDLTVMLNGVRCFCIIIELKDQINNSILEYQKLIIPKNSLFFTY